MMATRRCVLGSRCTGYSSSYKAARCKRQSFFCDLCCYGPMCSDACVRLHKNNDEHFREEVILLVIPYSPDEDMFSMGEDAAHLGVVRQWVDYFTGEDLVLPSSRGATRVSSLREDDLISSYVPVLARVVR